MTISPEVLKWAREEPLPHFLSLCNDHLACGRSIGETRAKLLSLPIMKEIIRDVAAEPWPPINSHRAAGHPLHKLSFLAEIGLDDEDLGLSTKIDSIMSTADEDGVLGLPMSIPRRFGGKGTFTSWALCDSPTLTYALVRMGRKNEPLVKKAVSRLISLIGSNGYRCITSEELGFRGPGRKDDPCPYANLVMLKLLSVAEPRGEAARKAAGALLQLWEQSRERHPYMFYMGTDFRKLKYPLVWYDLLHVCEVLSRFEWLRTDPRLVDMVEVMASQGDRQGRFTPGSVWEAWKGWDFGQKKMPSRTLTIAVHHVLARMVDSDG